MPGSCPGLEGSQKGLVPPRPANLSRVWYIRTDGGGESVSCQSRLAGPPESYGEWVKTSTESTSEAALGA